MLVRSALLALLTLGLTLSAADRKTIFIDRMDGLEQYVEEAIRTSEARVEFIEEREHPDLKVLLGKQFTSVYAEILYEKQTGRKGGYVLRAVDVKTGKEIASETFTAQTTDAGKRQVAGRFASKLKAKLAGAQ
jgi:hypothetical protein